MCTSELIKKVNAILHPYYLFLTMVLFFITSIFSASLWFAQKKSDIVVKVKYDGMEYPSSINNKFLSVFGAVMESVDSMRIHKEVNEVRSFLTETQNVKHIVIKNNRNRIISNIAFRDCSVTNLTAYGSGSSFRLSEEGKSLLKDMTYDSKSNILYLSEPMTLYPNEEVHITIWGSFRDQYGGESLFVNYDDKTAKVIATKEYSGFPAIVAEYYGFFFIVLLLVFSIVFFNSITQKKK